MLSYTYDRYAVSTGTSHSIYGQIGKSHNTAEWPPNKHCPPLITGDSILNTLDDNSALLSSVAAS